jgi:hypothetical protein
MGYGFRFAAHVKDGYFSGARGSEGQPGRLIVDGKIRPDGAASLLAQGLSGDPGSTIGNAPRGTSYTYHIDARFEGASASGKRVEVRPCDFTAVRQ